MKRLIDIECSGCGRTEIDVWRERGEYGDCECGKPYVRLHAGRKTGGVIGDDIPGGLLVPHGICNADGTPRRYYSKSEMAREAKARGWSNSVEHIPSELGSDKSKHTTRWS